MKKCKRRKKNKKPPKTLRYCPICDKTTLWEYNQNILHSECINCGGRNFKIENVNK